MKRLGSLFVVALVVGLLAAPVAAAPPATPSGPQGGPPVVKVGAASNSVLPTVDGSHAYLADLDVDPHNYGDPGLFVPEWDQGRVAVGNGDSQSFWVHDDLEVTAIAFEEQQTKDITVVVAANLYMIFRTDADVIRERALAALPADVASRTAIVITADHNHHGPDTAFDVNHDWYEFMVDQAADAVVRAVGDMRPARLSVAETEHYFGLRDSRDPRVMDPTLGVLQATATNGETIATLLFWANHPEVTLFWSPTEVDEAECVAAGLDPCDAEGRYFTSDFPGVAARIIEEQVGGEVAYFNGPVGNLVTPLGAQVWEVTEDAPLGDGLTPPPGAVSASGDGNYTDRNFRRMHIIGEQLALAALRALEDAEPIAAPAIDYTNQAVYTRMSNIGFRFLLVVGNDGWTELGHMPAELYTCPAAGPKNSETCVGDGLGTTGDPLLGTIREGDHARTEVGYLRIGPVGVMLIPAEIGAENVIGLPAGYGSTPELWHGDDPALHAFGADYATEGYVKNLMGDEYRWVIGLGNDELGYVVPLSDYRVFCVGDALAGPGTCQALYDAGAIEYPDAVAGSTCKAITEDPTLLAAYGPAAEAIAASCRYGQALGEADDHYEETNSLGWDLETDILEAVSALTGIADDSSINPDFPGYWTGFTP